MSRLTVKNLPFSITDAKFRSTLLNMAQSIEIQRWKISDSDIQSLKR